MASIVTAAEWMEMGYKVRRTSWHFQDECIESVYPYRLILWTDVEGDPETRWMHFGLDDISATDWEVF